RGPTVAFLAVPASLAFDDHGQNILAVPAQQHSAVAVPLLGIAVGQHRGGQYRFGVLGDLEVQGFLQQHRRQSRLILHNSQRDLVFSAGHKTPSWLWRRNRGGPRLFLVAMILLLWSNSAPWLDHRSKIIARPVAARQAVAVDEPCSTWG